jgi:hypothetical protein
MNRTQRRQAAHTKPLAPPRRRHTFGPSRPTLNEVRSSFAEIDHVFELLRSGEIEIHGDIPAFRRETTDEWFQLAPAMHGWCDLWSRLATHYHLPINTAPLRHLVDEIHNDRFVSKAEVEAAWGVINIARAAYSQMDVYEVKSFVRTIMIADRLEAAGLKGEPQ